MKFPWSQYRELQVTRRPTMQVFITNRCNLRCVGCFARKVMKDSADISMDEYMKVVDDFWSRGGKQINILGGEPLLHPELESMLIHNNRLGLKTTIYTNGKNLEEFSGDAFEKHNAKLRVSIYGTHDPDKGVQNLLNVTAPFDANYMVSRKTTVGDLLDVAAWVEHMGCGVFFISSLRELDNPRQEFFDDTELTMPVLQYKELVHEFLWNYKGQMEIHVSKRGVFESTVSMPGNTCNFVNYIIGGKIIQCPYDLVNEKYQTGYTLGKRPCQHNSTCLMSKVVYKRRRNG